MRFGHPVELKEDVWLGGHLGCPAFNLEVNPEILSGAGEPLVRLPGGKSFIQSKIPITDLESTNYLSSLGFMLVSTDVDLEKAAPSVPDSGCPLEIRFAKELDRSGVVDVASGNFMYSRFHLDPLMDNALADRIKGEWAGNFFAGKRGTHMVVALHEGRVAGFLQLIVKDGVFKIDLVAVGKSCRKKRAAQGMIEFAEESFGECSKFQVGTQLANIPSLNLYTKLGYRITSAVHIFHCHQG